MSSLRYIAGVSLRSQELFLLMSLIELIEHAGSPSLFQLIPAHCVTVTLAIVATIRFREPAKSTYEREREPSSLTPCLRFLLPFLVFCFFDLKTPEMGLGRAVLKTSDVVVQFLHLLPQVSMCCDAK